MYIYIYMYILYVYVYMYIFRRRQKENILDRSRPSSSRRNRLDTEAVTETHSGLPCWDSSTCELLFPQLGVEASLQN